MRDYGFDSSYPMVRRYVEQSRPREPKTAEERFDSAPGYQAQVDWSYQEPILTPEGLALPLYCFHVVLSHSRDSFCRLVGSMDLVTFWTSYRATFSHFGGISKEILYGRPKHPSHLPSKAFSRLD